MQDFREALALQRPHLFLWSPVFMGIGILVYFALPVEPPLWASILCAVMPLCGFVAVRKHELWRVVLILCLCIGAGFCAGSLRTMLVHTEILPREISPVNISGTIAAIEHLPGEETARIILEHVSIEDIAPEKTPRRIRVKLHHGADLRVGQRVEMLVGLNPPSAPVLPGGFDFQRYMYFKGIGAVGFAYGGANVLDAPELSRVQDRIENLRTHIAFQLTERLGDTGAVAAALMVGQRAGITNADQEAMRHAGLAHMLAISGLHVGLFFGAVFFAVRLFMAGFPSLALRAPIKKYAAVLAMSAAVFYMLLAGATIPTQRAVLMMGVVFLAIMLDRTPLSMRLVAFAALVILLLAPESLLSASFQMSFSAVAGLVAFYEWLRPYWSAVYRKAGFLRRAGLYFAGVSMTTVIATLATAPFALFHFQQVALYSLLSNILAMPVLAFVVMPFVVMYFWLMPLGLEGVTLPVIGWGVGLIVDIARFVSGLDHAALHTKLWPGQAMLFFAAAFVMFLLAKGRLRFIALVPFSVFIVAIFNIKQPTILISSSSDLIALQDQSGSLSFSNLQKDRFTREQWSRAYGQEGRKARKWLKEGGAGGLICGEKGCRLEREGYKISFIRDIEIVPAECAWADIVISPDPVDECGDAYVIDRFDTYRNGAYAVYLEPSLKTQTTADARGQRPWVASRF